MRHKAACLLVGYRALQRLPIRQLVKQAIQGSFGRQLIY